MNSLNNKHMCVPGTMTEFTVIVDEEEDEEGGRFLVDFHKKLYAKVINLK